jgi:hypothetical protein
MRNAILIIVATLTCPEAAWSQVSTSPTRLEKPFPIDRAYNDLQTLTQLYNAGKWAQLEDAAKELLEAAKTKHSSNAIRDALDATKHYIIVTWIGTDAFDKPMLPRIVVHGPGTKRAARTTNNANVGGTPMVVDLPGVGAGNDPVYEVFFSRGTRGKIADVYVSTRDKNPTSEELPAFVQAIASPLFETVGVFAGAVTRTEDETANGSIAATVFQVSLPFERATIKWKAVAREPVTQQDFESALGTFAARLKFTEVPHSLCAQNFIDQIVETLKTTVAGRACSADDPAAASSCRASVGTALAATYAAQKCGSPPSQRAPSDAEKTDFLSIDKKARAFVDENLTLSVDTEMTFKNRPPTHWTFGFGSGVIGSASLTKPRVKLDDDTIAADPMPRVMTLAFVNWSPAGYDAERDDLSLAERVRPFFGATLTPDFGIAGGANVLLARGIGIVGGVTVMFAKGASPEEIGKVPANPDQPFAISYAKAVFAGISYNFK